MIKLASWNIRGLNAPLKQREVKEFIRCNGINLCAILESHVHRDVLEGLCCKVFGRWEWGTNVACSEGGTRIIIAWDVAIMDVMILEVHSQFIHCQIQVRGELDPFFVSICYGGHNTVERRQLWSGLRKFKVLMGCKPWLLMGDFNAILFPHDGVGGSSRRGVDMTEFCMCLDDIEVFDVSYSGVQYTWCQKPTGGDGIMRKLDRIMANTDFTNRFLGVSVVFLARGVSDHSPGIISFNGGNPRKHKGFKVDNFVLEHPKFLETVTKGWAMEVVGSFMFCFTTRLKGLKKPIRGLRSEYGNMAKRAELLKEELLRVQLACDLDPHSVDLREDMVHLLLAFKQARRDQLLMLSQRAKVKWLNEGDSNTRYFHQVLKERKGQGFVRSTYDVDGNFRQGDEVADAFVTYFRSIQGELDSEVQPSMEDFPVSTRLNLPDSLFMIRPISDEEIKTALFGIGNNKAPGSDGFPSKFYKVAWPVIGKDFLIAVHNFFYTSHLSRELNHTLLALIPKSPNAMRVTEYRPISCCNVIYKCITKVIVNRMKESLASLISPCQSAFIPGRRIVDNILMAHELVVGYQRNRGTPRCAFKIDIKKAYDMVSWEYVINMMKAMGFHPALVRWVEELITHPSYSIVINGQPEGFFHGKRGIRQGDPLSPYLFTIVMEGFSRIFRKCMMESSEFGYHEGCQELDLTHLCFADDLFVFTRGDVGSVAVLKRALHIFRMKSGLAPSLEKSDIFFGGVDTNTKVAIREYLGFREGVFPIRYLGVPLSPVRLSNADFQPLITKVRNRIHNWKAKYLSFAGRRQLISSVLQSMQLYWMGVFLVPAGVIHELEAMFRNFLWAHGESAKGKCRLAWEMVCRQRIHGGLGIRRLAMWNRAMLATHLWNILVRADSIWVSWVYLHRLQHHSLWTVRAHSSWPWVFRRILALREHVRQFVRITIGDGSLTNAWNDAWLPFGQLALAISYRLFTQEGFSIDSMVMDVINRLHGSWPVAWVSRDERFHTCEVPTIQPGRRDVTNWIGSDGQIMPFTVRDCVRSMEGTRTDVAWWNDVWFQSHIPKHAFCMWLACHERLPTQDRILAWKHEPPDPKCPLCTQCLDSHYHLFFQCPYSIAVWHGIKAEAAMDVYPDDWYSILDFISSVGVKRRKLHKLSLAATIYFIWQERNWRLFRDASRPPLVLIKKIRDVVLQRMAWRKVIKSTVEGA